MRGIRIMQSVALVLCLTLFMPNALNLAQAGGEVVIYDEVVQIADKSAAARQASLPAAFGNVLVRATGDADILDLPAVKLAQKHAETYLQAYSYQTIKTGHNNELAIKLMFDEGRIKQFIRDQNRHLWGAWRPNVLIWVAAAKDPEVQSTTLIVDDETSPMVQAWREAAKIRGIFVTFPMNDLTTLTKVDATDVWQLRRDKLAQLSERYHTDTQVVVLIKPTAEGRWMGEIHGIEPNSKLILQRVADNEDSLVIGLNDELTQYFAEQHRQLTASQISESIRIVVKQVNQLADIQKVQTFINHLTHVKRVNIVSINDAAVIFEVIYQGSEQSFTNAVRYQSPIQAIIPKEDEQQQADLYFRYKG